MAARCFDSGRDSRPAGKHLNQPSRVQTGKRTASSSRELSKRVGTIGTRARKRSTKPNQACAAAMARQGHPQNLVASVQNRLTIAAHIRPATTCVSPSAGKRAWDPAVLFMYCEAL